MKYSDVEKKLDMQFGISLEFRHDLLPLISRDMESIPLSLSYTEKSSYLDLFIRADEERRLSGIISSFKPAIKGEYLIVRIPGEQVQRAIEPLTGLLDIKSSVPAEIYIMNDRLYSFSRFHSSEIDQVSSILGKAVMAGMKARLEFLGPSIGGVKTIDRVDRRIKLSAITFEFNRTYETKEELLQEHIGEVHIELLTSEKYRAILYPEEPSKWGKVAEPVSSGDGIFTVRGSIKVLQDLYARCNAGRIPVAAAISKGNTQTLRVSHFIPLLFRDDFIRILFDVSRSNADSQVRLIEVRDYSSKIWENM